MSNPIFRDGPLTFDVAEDVKKHRLVQLTANGVKHATATSDVFGAVVNDGAKLVARTVNDLRMGTGTPNVVGVHCAPATVELEATTNATAITPGTKVYADADGKIKTGTGKLVGIAVRKGEGNTVAVRLLTPVAAS